MAVQKGISDSSLQAEIENSYIFVKKVPITNLELQPENYTSAANIVNLLMC